MILSAPAKINLHLKVLGRRGDGYHDLRMVMVRLTLADQLEIELGGEGIVIESSDSRLPVDRSNTLWKAAHLVGEESGKKFGLRIRLVKKIPVAAGLGGGSSDAATLMRGLNDLLGLGWSRERLRSIGVKIGADLPFFFSEGSQLVEGIGDRLSPLSLPSLPVVLINPGFPVSTADAYRWFDETSQRGIPSVPSGTPPETEALRNMEEIILTEGGGVASFPPLENDLEEVVIPRYPVLAAMKGLLRRSGALGTLMSGSGPTVFGLFESTESRDRGYEKILASKDPRWWVCSASGVD